MRQVCAKFGFILNLNIYQFSVEEFYVKERDNIVFQRQSRPGRLCALH